MVECDLAKVEVAGSNPVSRSTLKKIKLYARLNHFSGQIYRLRVSLSGQTGYTHKLGNIFFRNIAHYILLNRPLNTNFTYHTHKKKAMGSTEGMHQETCMLQPVHY